MDAEYGPGLVVSNGGIQRWTVARSGIYGIEAHGSQGGSIVVTLGTGASISGDFALNEGDIITVRLANRASGVQRVRRWRRDFRCIE